MDVLLSIKPRWIEKIRSGEKTVELRKTWPKWFAGGRVYAYETSPTKRIVGWMEVDSLVRAEPQELWEVVGQQSCVDKEAFDEYYKGKGVGCGICIKEFHPIQPLPIGIVAKCPPQSWISLTEAQSKALMEAIEEL